MCVAPLQLTIRELARPSGTTSQSNGAMVIKRSLHCAGPVSTDELSSDHRLKQSRTPAIAALRGVPVRVTPNSRRGHCTPLGRRGRSCTPHFSQFAVERTTCKTLEMRDEAHAQALRTFAGNGFGDAAIGRTEPHDLLDSVELYHLARAHRSYYLREIVKATLQAVGDFVRRTGTRWKRQEQARATCLALRSLDAHILLTSDSYRSELMSVAAEVGPSRFNPRSFARAFEASQHLHRRAPSCMKSQPDIHRSDKRPLRQVHRSLQAHPLGHRPRRDSRAQVRLRKEVPA